PIISEENSVEAGGEAFLNGVSRTRTVQLGLVNLGAESTSCSVDFVRADGTLAGGNVQVELPAVSLRLVGGPLGPRRVTEDVSVRATCDQPFFAFSVERNPSNSRITFISPAAQAALTATTAEATAPAPIVFERPGQIHFATKANPKLKLAVPVTKALQLD